MAAFFDARSLGEEMVLLLEKMQAEGANENYREAARLSSRINGFLDRNRDVLSPLQIWVIKRGLVKMNQQRVRANIMEIVMDIEDVMRPEYIYK